MDINEIDYKKYLPNWISDSLGTMIGEGAEGHVFNFGKNRVIKIASLGYGFDRSWIDIRNVLDSLVRNPKEGIVRIYFYGVLNKKPLVYFYVAEKLKPLSKVQQQIVEDCVEGDVIDYDILNACFEKSTATRNKKLIDVLDNLTNQQYSNRARFNIYDIHKDNIMKDKSNNFKLCDVGLIELKKKFVRKKKLKAI